MELQKNTHHVYRFMYHFVWIPKYRHKIFVEPQRESMKAIISKIGYDYDIDIVELEIPEDHIYMVVRCEPKLSPSKIMRIIKSISARGFFRLFPEIRKNIFGEANYGLKAFSLNLSERLMKRALGSMFRIN